MRDNDRERDRERDRDKKRNWLLKHKLKTTTKLHTSKNPPENSHNSLIQLQNMDITLYVAQHRIQDQLLAPVNNRFLTQYNESRKKPMGWTFKQCRYPSLQANIGKRRKPNLGQHVAAQMRTTSNLRVSGIRANRLVGEKSQTYLSCKTRLYNDYIVGSSSERPPITQPFKITSPYNEAFIQSLCGSAELKPRKLSLVNHSLDSQRRKHLLFRQNKAIKTQGQCARGGVTMLNMELRVPEVQGRDIGMLIRMLNGGDRINCGLAKWFKNQVSNNPELPSRISNSKLNRLQTRQIYKFTQSRRLTQNKQNRWRQQ